MDLNNQSLQDTPRGYQLVTIRRRDVILNNLMGGIAWGFGTFLGATVIIAIGFWLLGQLGAVPFLGDQLNNIIKQIDLKPITDQSIQP